MADSLVDAIAAHGHHFGFLIAGFRPDDDGAAIIAMEATDMGDAVNGYNVSSFERPSVGDTMNSNLVHGCTR